jgi:hypothetical protein
MPQHLAVEYLNSFLFLCFPKKRTQFAKPSIISSPQNEQGEQAKIVHCPISTHVIKFHVINFHGVI